MLIVRVGAMGDVLHGLPAVAAVRRAHPDWVIDWAVEPRWSALLARGAVVSSVVEVRARDWKRWGLSVRTLRDIWGLRGALRAGRYDVCVDLQGSWRSAVIGWMAGGKRFVGAERPRELGARVFYGERVRVRAAHVIDQACELVSVGIGERVVAGDWEVPVDGAAERWADGVVSGGMKKVVVIAASAGWGAKEWPVERFGDLASRLVGAGCRVFVNADGGGWGKAEEVVRASGGRAVAVRCTIAELASLLRRADLFVGGDTGPIHLADALGVRVVALFGPTDPARTGPYRAGARVLRDAGSRTDHRRYGETEAGLLRVTVDEVFGAAMELIGE